MVGQDKPEEHPTSAIFNRSNRLHGALVELYGDVEFIKQTLLSSTPPKEMMEAEIPKLPLLDDIKFRFQDHINEVEKIQKIVSMIKMGLINTPKIEGSGEKKMAVRI